MLSEELKMKFDRFWNHTAEGFLVSITVHSKDNQNTDDISPTKKWFDLDYRLKQIEADIDKNKYYGDAFPWVFSNIGPGCLAACIGGSFLPDNNTIWFDQDPIIHDWNDLPIFQIYEDSQMWKTMTRFMEMLLDNSCGRYNTSIPDIGGPLDIIASLRNTNDLLFDLYENPQPLISLTDRIAQIWEQAYDILYNMITKKQHGTTTWIPVWSRGRTYTLQCDFCAMISPDMFKTFVLPHLAKETGHYPTEYLETMRVKP